MAGKGWYVTGLVGGALATLCSVPHAMGWGSIKAALMPLAPSQELLQSLEVAWLWGSFAMLGMGSVVCSEALGALKGKDVNRVAIAGVSFAYLGFALWAASLLGVHPLPGLFAFSGLTFLPLLKK